MTIEEKKAVLLLEIPWLTVSLCKKLEEVVKIRSLYGLLRVNWELLEKKGFTRDELFQINGALFRLGFTFLPNTRAILIGFVVRWEEHSLSTEFSTILPEIAEELKENGVVNIGDLYTISEENGRRRIVAHRNNLVRCSSTVRQYHADTIQPWIDFSETWEKVRTRRNGNGSNV